MWVISYVCVPLANRKKTTAAFSSQLKHDSTVIVNYLSPRRLFGHPCPHTICRLDSWYNTTYQLYATPVGDKNKEKRKGKHVNSRLGTHQPLVSSYGAAWTGGWGGWLGGQGEGKVKENRRAVVESYRSLTYLWSNGLHHVLWASLLYVHWPARTNIGQSGKVVQPTTERRL